MSNWKLNLVVLWLGQFLVLAGMTMITPFLPFYIQELGITDAHSVALWGGLIFAANFVTSFFAQPIWGSLADRYGRKMMLLRSGFGMALVIVLMGFATHPWQLLLLRMVNGTISGFAPAAVSLMSANTPKEKMGFALGTLQSGSVGGSILGPLIGGLMAEWIGYRPIFYVTGVCLFGASLLALFFVKESFDAKKAVKQPKESIVKGFKELSKTPQLPSLYSVTLLIQFAMLSAMPLIPLFVQELHGQDKMLALYAGLVGSVTGFSNMIASPLLGKLSDKIGPEKVLSIALIGAALSFIPQAFVTNIWQLMASRFILGLFMGGMLPSVQTLIRRFTPNGKESRSFSYNSSALSLGNMLGPVIGGALSGWIGIKGIFLMSCALLLVNAAWVRKTLYVKPSHETETSVK
ncbi:MFS transporter [Paenibacillus thalictri]|uniref:MFS transporter n=1 Tax=Paenibacillus thalictri TaxID=2527873 RepID=A0A4V2J4U7_9BACL|nr:MFS transporter [Paenibacillus thalictri]TBL81262.1 MFS transporter [Paenibacillus thalictri]